MPYVILKYIKLKHFLLSFSRWIYVTAFFYVITMEPLVSTVIELAKQLDRFKQDGTVQELNTLIEQMTACDREICLFVARLKLRESDSEHLAKNLCSLENALKFPTVTIYLARMLDEKQEKFTGTDEDEKRLRSILKSLMKRGIITESRSVYVYERSL